MDPKLIEMLERLSELSDPELKQLDKDLVAEFNKMDSSGGKNGGHTPEVIDAMEQVAQASGRVRGEIAAKTELARETAERAENLRSQMTPAEEAKTDKAEKADDKPKIEDADVVQLKGPEAPVGDAPASLAASADAPKIGEVVAPDSRPATKAPAVVRASAQWKASGAVRGPDSPDRGQLFESAEQMAIATVEAIESLGRGSGTPVLVASLIKQFPKERTLGRDAMENYAKLEAVAGREALVATGGICAPVNVDYNIAVGASDAEPLGQALPDFSANRGGLRFLATPTFASVGASGTGIWTAATDAAPGGATKPVQTISCGAEQVVLVDAIPTRLRFGNMMDRFSPEVVAANTQLAMANAARVREINRLTKIAAASTPVSTGQLLGAARDFLATLDQACAAARYRHRLDDNQPMMAILPRFLKDMIRADFVREIGHSDNMFAASDAQIEQMMRAPGRNVTPVWMMDGQAGATAAGLTYSQQGFGAQTTGGLLDWPRIVTWYLFPVGTFQRLDGGRLDVGVVRDSILDSTNDYEVFVETFEGIAFRGFESLQLISQLRPNGTSAGTVNTTTY